MQDLRSQRDLTAYVESRGFKVERVFNSVAVVQDGAELKVMALTLLGPRRNKGFVSLDDGNGDFNMVKLWCDGVDYATAQVAKRREFRKRRVA